MRSHQESIAKTTADTLEDAKIKSSKCKLVKSIKPLVNYKFYLDIERHNILLKIESKIRELGGSIEFFLTKDITHFITDKKVSSAIVASTQHPTTVTTPQTPLTPKYLSPVVARTPSSNDLKTRSRILTRADAMLYRARKGTCETIENNRKSKATVLTNPSQIAESWGTPVWHTEYALKFLDKVYSYIKERYISNTNSIHHNIKNAQIFKGNYIKIESSQKGYYRPYYKIFNSKWPVINLKPNRNGVFPLTAADENYFYDSEKNTIDKQKPTIAKTLVNTTAKKIQKSNLKSDMKMTRKNRSTSKRQQGHIKTPSSVAGPKTTTTINTVNSNKQILSSENQCGFCEICRVEYDTLTVHLKSETHLNFVKNENNFLALDSLIKSSGTNMDKFLSLNDTNNGNAKMIESITNSDNIQNSIVSGTPTVPGIHFSSPSTPSKKQRSSTRVSNSTQLKATLSTLSAPNLPSQQLLSQKLSQQTAPITFTTYVNRDNKTNPFNKELYHNDQHQIEILEKTTTLGHTRQTRQQSSINQQNQQLDVKIPLQRQQPIINDEQKLSDSIMAARAKRQSVKKINYAEPKEDEENSVDDLIHGYHRHQRKKKSKLKDKSTTLNATTKAIKERRSSQSDIKPLPLPLPTSLLYKVVETTTDNSKKIKTSKKCDIISTETIPAKNNFSKMATETTHRHGVDEQDEDKEKLKEDTQSEKNNKKPSPIIVKIRKVRKSELSILSGEAVNFMFPRRRTSSSEPTDIDRQTTSDDVCKGTYGSSFESSSSNNTSRLPEEWRLTERKTALKRKQLSLSSSLNLNSTSTTTTVDIESGNPKKRRRLELNYREDDNDEREEEIGMKTVSPIKATIAEEDDKISENHCIDLRSSPRLLRKNPPLRTYGRRKLGNKHKDSEQETNTKESLKKKNDISTRQKVLNIPSLDNIVNEKLIKYKYAFERIPNNELWYQVFNRQDEGFEKSFEYFGSTVYRKLPYEMGPIRPITKSSCTLCHIHSNKTTEITEKKSKSSPKKEKSKNESSSNKQSIASMSIATTNTSKKIRNRKVLNRAAAALINLEMPRKSPREHASTLAILSCLLQRKNAQQQQQKSEQQINSSSSLPRLQQFSPKKNTTNKTEQNNDFINLNNEICTQISENVKRLRRGEKISNTAATTSTTISSPINSKRNLLELKRKSTKQKKNIRKLASSSSYSRNKKEKLQFEISGTNIKEDRQTEQYINALRLEKDIDEFFTSTISNDNDLNMESSQINFNALGGVQDDGDNIKEKFPEFSQDFNLYELIQQQQKEDIGNIRGSKSNKHLFGGGGGVINTFNSSSVYRDINKFRLFKINSTNKKRKNKTGWPTTKRRTTTRQQTRQQQLQQQHEKYNKSIKENDKKEILKIDINSTVTASTTITTNVTTNPIITVTTMTTDTCNVGNKYSKVENDINDMSTNSPITPPESDNDNYYETINNDYKEDDDDTNHHQYPHDTNSYNHENDCDEDRNTEKTDFGETISNLRTPTKTIDCRNSTINHSNLLHPYNNHQTLNYHHHHHNHFNQHQQNFSSSDKTECVSDIFTVSSDSLDTVLDVGSQIKSEDQEEIIAISKCNGKKLNNNQQNHRHNIILATAINNDSDSICNNEGDYVVDYGNDNDDDDVITATTTTTDIATTNNSVLKQKLTSSVSSSPSSLLIRKCSNPNFPNYINNKKLKYSNSMKLNSSSSSPLSSSLSTGELGRLNSMTVANISATASSSINCFDPVNNIKFNSRKLSNNSSGKDLKVVVVVKRERNNSISSGSSSTNNKSSKPLITTETINTKSLSSSDAIMDANKHESVVTSEVSVQDIIPTNNNLSDTINESMTAQTTPLSVQTTTISPRRLRKPRGRWYRER